MTQSRNASPKLIHRSCFTFVVVAALGLACDGDGSGTVAGTDGGSGAVSKPSDAARDAGTGASTGTAVQTGSATGTGKATGTTTGMGTGSRSATGTGTGSRSATATGTGSGATATGTGSGATATTTTTATATVTVDAPDSVVESQKIVYPRRATTAIVPAGSTFEVWVNADSGQTISSVTLRSPYTAFSAEIASTSTTTWTYDSWSKYTCNRRLVVSVPANAPVDKYDLILNTSTGTVASLKSVKVIKEYRKSFYIMHISDAHRWESTGEPIPTMREISTILEVADILNPEFLIETGDNFWGNRESEAARAARATKMMEGFMEGAEHIRGVHDTFAAYLAVPGNHDTRANSWDREPNLVEPSEDWNKQFGLQAHNTIYGSARIMGLNNSWGSSDKWQIEAANSWLAKVGAGTFRIALFHNPDSPASLPYNGFKANGTPLSLILAGHIHKTSTNPISIDGKPIIYTANKNKYSGTSAKCPFNVYKVDLAAGTFAPIGNPQAANYAIATPDDYKTRKLQIAYSKPNNGTSTDNVGTVVNKFTFPISGARIRFVMAKGNKYVVTGATVTQAFDGAKYHIVDASYDLDANGTKTVSISK